MGYRLEISKIEPCCDGGKLYGYIDEEDLRKCKSWKWLKEKGCFVDFDGDDDDDYATLWDYGVDHRIVMYPEDFEEFIKLYIEDKKKYGPYHQYGECLEDYAEALKSQHKVLIEWY